MLRFCAAEKEHDEQHRADAERDGHIRLRDDEQTDAPARRQHGSIPRKVRIRSGFSEAYAAAKTTKPYFAISEGWTVTGPMPIQRVAP